MAKKNSRGFFSSVTNVREWIALDDIVAYARLIKKSWKDLMSYGKRDTAAQLKKENFEETIQRLQLSEEDIVKRRKYFFYYFLIYGVIAIVAIIYWIYLFTKTNSILALMVGFIISIMMITFALREHYWYMQMKLRRFNCTYKDWFAFICGRIKK